LFVIHIFHPYCYSFYPFYNRTGICYL